MPSANLCQTEALADADITSLCFTCKWRPECGWAGWSEAIGSRQEPGVRRLHVIAECSEYYAEGGRPLDEDPSYKSLRPRLWKAGIRDLCCGCPSAEQNACERNQQLDDLTARSQGGNQWIKSAMICCTATGDRLYQIAEPAAK